MLFFAPRLERFSRIINESNDKPAMAAAPAADIRKLETGVRCPGRATLTLALAAVTALGRSHPAFGANQIAAKRNPLNRGSIGNPRGGVRSIAPNAATAKIALRPHGSDRAENGTRKRIKRTMCL
jgi:hypothetical protein